MVHIHGDVSQSGNDLMDDAMVVELTSPNPNLQAESQSLYFEK